MPENPAYTVRINTTARTIVRVLITIDIALALISLAGQILRYRGTHDYIFGLIDLFDVNSEDSIPTVFSGMQLFTAALLLFAVNPLKIAGRFRLSWLALGAGFLLMTLDELISLHERVSFGAADVHTTGKLVETFWVFPAMILVLFVVLSFIPFLRGLPPKIRNGMLLSGGLFLAGAVGVETLELIFAHTHGMKNLPFQIFTTIEEFLEMFGITLFIGTLLRYVALHYPVVTFLKTGREDDGEFAGH